MAKRKARTQIGSLTPQNRPDPKARRWNATRRWKDVDKNYKFTSDLIPIGGLNKELWPRKMAGVQTGTVLELLLRSPRIKSHSDVGAVERCREYYMGEGGGFPWIRVVVSLANPKLPVACPSTKGAPKNELTNLLIGLMKVWVSK